MTKSIIFYGAGKNAIDNFECWKEKVGVPECFVDADEKKHYTKFNGTNIDILPLDVALQRYPDCDIYLTPGAEKLTSIVKNMLKNEISLSRIKFFEPLEYRRGCTSMGRTIVFADKIQCCCVPVFYKDFCFDIVSDPSSNFEEYHKRAEKMVKAWRSGQPTGCDGCPQLQYGVWRIEPEIEFLNISSKDNEDFCNAKCIYCSQYPRPQQEKYESRKKEIIDMLETAHRLYPNRVFRVTASGGEIAVAPFRDELFSILKNYGWSAEIYSNSLAFCSGVAEQLKDGVSTYITTLDSTIPEKFAEIKGVNGLPKVLENIRRYSDSALKREQIRIKVIILDGVYSSFEEIKGVIDFVHDIGAVFMLSCNVDNVKNRLSSHMYEITEKCISYAQNKGVPLDIMFDHFHLEDAEALRKQLGL